VLSHRRGGKAKRGDLMQRIVGRVMGEDHNFGLWRDDR